MAARGLRLQMGADDGCFAAALGSVRAFGGVLEHPEASHAWTHFGLTKPPRSGGWIPAGDGLGLTCCIEQGAYGHKARKATWLYYVGKNPPPELKWGRAPGEFVRLESGFHSAEERRRAGKKGVVQLLSHKERAKTPIQFRDLLIDMARRSS